MPTGYYIDARQLSHFLLTMEDPFGMEMHQVRYFLALCETPNFASAAETCNVSKPALTRECISLAVRSWCWRGHFGEKLGGCCCGAITV